MEGGGGWWRVHIKSPTLFGAELYHLGLVKTVEETTAQYRQNILLVLRVTVKICFRFGTTPHTDLIKHVTRPVSYSFWLYLVETDALFGKTEDPFCQIDIGVEAFNMYMFCIRCSNVYLFWPNRGRIGQKNLNKNIF